MFPVHHLTQLDLSPGWPVMVRRVVGGMQADRVIVASTGSEDIFITPSLSLSPLYFSYLEKLCRLEAFLMVTQIQIFIAARKMNGIIPVQSNL